MNNYENIIHVGIVFLVDSEYVGIVWHTTQNITNTTVVTNILEIGTDLNIFLKLDRNNIGSNEVRIVKSGLTNIVVSERGRNMTEKR